MKAHSINPRALGTNSLVNAVMASYKAPTPKVGMGATILMYTDRHACTIVEVTPRAVVIQQDIATRTDNNGLSESQDYTYAPNPAAKRETFTLRKTGRYVRKGEPAAGGTHLAIGTRDEYYDPSF